MRGLSGLHPLTEGVNFGGHVVQQVVDVAQRRRQCSQHIVGLLLLRLPAVACPSHRQLPLQLSHHGSVLSHSLLQHTHQLSIFTSLSLSLGLE